MEVVFTFYLCESTVCARVNEGQLTQSVQIPACVYTVLRQIAENRGSISGLFCKPCGSLAGDDLWENLHRALTCLMGFAAWTKEIVTLRQLPVESSLIAYSGRKSTAGKVAAKKRRSASLYLAQETMNRRRKEM